MSVALKAAWALISIHTPRVGRDFSKFTTLMMLVTISIHTPRVGRDCDRRIAERAREQFQSTRPVWGATASIF